jgi:uncharacterized OB-fold protein
VSDPRWFPDAMPIPAASTVTLPWWRAAADHRLVVQVCEACRATRHPPSPRCPSCHSSEATWRELPGTGTVYTFTVVHQAFLPALADRVPYVVAVVELDEGEGARLVTNIVDTPPSRVRVGDPVSIVFEDMGPELALPRAFLDAERGRDA